MTTALEDALRSLKGRTYIDRSTHRAYVLGDGRDETVQAYDLTLDNESIRNFQAKDLASIDFTNPEDLRRSEREKLQALRGANKV